MGLLGDRVLGQQVLGLENVLVGMGKKQQLFCSSPDGWGPLGPIGSYLTECFLDSMIDGLNVFMVLVGLLQLFWYSKADALPVKRTWLYWTKLTLVVSIFATTLVQATLQTQYIKHWAVDISFYTTLFSLVSFGIVLALHHAEYYKSRAPSGVLLLYWLFFIILNALKLQTYIETKVYERLLPVFIVFCCALGFSVAVFLIHWLVEKEKTDYTAIVDEDDIPCPLDDANVFSVLSFSWITPLMKQGYNAFLTEEDLWSMRKQDSTEECGRKFGSAWQGQLEREKPSIWRALVIAFGKRFLTAGLFKAVHDCLAFVQPQLLRLLITYIQSWSTDEPQRLQKGMLIAFSMFACSVLQTLVLHQYFQRAFETGMHVKAGVSTSIFKKAMVLSNEGRASKTTGDIVNLMAVDTQRLDFLCQYGQNIWSSPFQIVICTVSLYNLVGYSMFAGLGFMALMVPVNWQIARIMKRLQVTQMKNKDNRTKLLTEIINNMKSIKLYAWGKPFMSKLNEVRNKELSTLRKVGTTSALSNFAWQTTPFVVSCLTFATFSLTQKKPLTTDIVFPALTLFNLLTFPLAMLPMVLSMIVEAMVAGERITSMLTAEEIQADAVKRGPAANRPNDIVVKISDGRFTWNRELDGDKDVLRNINFQARKGDLSCVVARVGQGKSSLLQALLGDLWLRQGTVEVNGSVAYVAQQPWVMNATVKENILFGHRFDSNFYERTIEACALKEDIAILPDGDETEVGEKGISLSGGQKARLSLARAVYARADVYFFDDPLSAVDQHVGRHLIDNVLGPNGLLAGKTKIMATNSIPVLSVADYITLLKDGEVVEAGTYEEVMATKKGIYNLIKTIKESDSSDDNTSSSAGSSTPRDEESNTEISDNEEGMDKVSGDIPAIKPNRRMSSKSMRRASAASINRKRRVKADDETRVTRQTKETVEQGTVNWDVYIQYAKSSSLIGVAIYMLLLAGSQMAQIGSSIWLKNWAEYNETHPKEAHLAKWIGIYFGIGMGYAFLYMFQNLLMYIVCAIQAARKLHSDMANAIFRSPMSFFETTPTGRILNRFSSDVYKIDEVLARSFNQLFSNTARCFATLIIISVTTPAFTAAIIPLMLLYLWIQRYYLYTSRELKRLDSVSRSPVFAQFQESLGGISTIRAYKQEQRFETENENRLDANLRAYFPSMTSNRWLAIRLEFIGSIIIFGSALTAVITASTTKGGISAGSVGLAMSYALSITQALNWLVRQSVEVETNIVSVERVLEYTRLKPEAPETIKRSRPSVGWPADGGVKFKNYSTKYREGLDLVLKDISLDIKPQEKIGIVGRTGAGKSSLTLAMFRIIEPTSGHVEIDNLNTSSIGLLDLRKRLAIIPQDAMITSGSLRENLDPTGVHDDTELWTVLDLSHLREHVSKMEGKLDAVIQEGGSNLSAGQRQLVCLARALLTPSTILILDEATAAVDVETDTLLQQTIREEFKNRTIITIAHRINTIMDSDRIVVLSAGKVAEFDTPKALLAKGSDSLFHGLVKEAGLLDEAEVIVDETVPTRPDGGEEKQSSSSSK